MTMESNNQDALNALLHYGAQAGITQADVDAWLEKNPVPEKFRGGKYEYAYLEMPLFSAYFCKLIDIFRGKP